MRRSAAALLYLVGCGPKAPPGVAPAPSAASAAAAPALLRPSAAPAAAADWPPTPPQPGLASGQELTAMLSSRSTFTVDADLSPLADLDCDGVAQLATE